MGFVPLILVCVVLTPLLWLELRRYTAARLTGQVSDTVRARLGRRVLSAGLLLLVTALVGFGVEFREHFRPAQLVGYLTMCLILLAVLVVTMVYDIRTVLRQSLFEFYDRAAEAERFQAFMARESDALPKVTNGVRRAGKREPLR